MTKQVLVSDDCMCMLRGFFGMKTLYRRVMENWLHRVSVLSEAPPEEAAIEHGVLAQAVPVPTEIGGILLDGIDVY